MRDRTARPTESEQVMTTVNRRPFTSLLVRMATTRTYWALCFVALLTAASLLLAGRLELRMNWTDLLPSDHPQVRLYRDVQERFGEASLVVALEGDRDATVAMAEELEPRLQRIESLYNVQGRMPADFLLDHGFVLLKPAQFQRALRSFEDWTLVGSLRGMNDDYEREYTDSESNLRRDEVEVARGVLGLTRALELLAAGIAGEVGPTALREAADALAVGDPWLLSLDRRLLLIACTPHATTDQIDELLVTVEEVEATVREVAANHPTVHASLTGMAKISQDEMNSIGTYTMALSVLALVMIFLLLARAFRGWVMPIIALAPLLIGIIWTMAALELLFGGLNLFTAMMMLVLLGLGIDFSIHLISRYQEETSHGASPTKAFTTTISGTGTAVTMGAVTTAIAFLTLMVGETAGVSEFGVAAGLGVLITLLAIFLTLPALLVIRHRILEHRGSTTIRVSALGNGYQWIGRIAVAGSRHPAVFLASTVVLVGVSVWAVRHTGYEYDFLELEPEGLRSVELQREIPERFGTSDHSAWSIAESIEESRILKERFRELPEVGDVSAVSDYVPGAQRIDEYRPALTAFRRDMLTRRLNAWQSGDAATLGREVDRLWDNLDLISNLAYAAGLDRIVRVIDQITGVDSETGRTDSTATLPTLSRRLADTTDDTNLASLAQVWAGRMKSNLERLSNPSPVVLEEIPENFRRSFTPRYGDGYLIHVIPRRYIWDKPSLERFAQQTEEVDPSVVGSEKLILLMMDETLRDGERAALLAVAMIALLLMLHFRGPFGLLALIPLAVGSVTMLGLMYVFGMTYNYMNLIATPIILGIGIDDGVHALHRYREDGGRHRAQVAKSFQSVGKAILLTSLTTMIGFGSVALYEMRGLASFGKVLFMGVGACFLATIFVLPPLLRIIARISGATAESEAQ